MVEVSGFSAKLIPACPMSYRDFVQSPSELDHLHAGMGHHGAQKELGL